jgi:hypothetical protein
MFNDVCKRIKVSSRFMFLVILATIITSCAPIAFASTLDQKQEISDPAITIMGNMPIGQTFKPSLPVLEAIEVKIITMNSEGDDNITLNIRQGTMDGTIVATTSKLIAYNFDGGNGEWVMFSFTPVPVIPESTYIIELQASTYTFGWLWYEDVYPRGAMIQDGFFKGNDFTFRTYGSEEIIPVGGILEPTKISGIEIIYLTMIILILFGTSFYYINNKINPVQRLL